jgi:membrane-associated protein
MHDLLQPFFDYLKSISGSPWFYCLIFLIVFCETGLVVTPFLPGDSLLFFLGTLTIANPERLPILIGLLAVAAVIGDAVNYAIGYRLGPKVFKYEGSWFFNKKHLMRAQEFYEKYGSKTIILARFVPIVRTFAPFVAGIGKMSYPKFFLYNVVGAVAWVVICVMSGYFFGKAKIPIPFTDVTFEVERNFEMVMVAIVAISVMPMVVEFVLNWRRQRAARNSPETTAVEKPVAERAA